MVHKNEKQPIKQQNNDSKPVQKSLFRLRVILKNNFIFYGDISGSNPCITINPPSFTLVKMTKAHRRVIVFR